MALAPKFAGQAWPKSSQAVHTIELYLDYVCPYSAKMFNTLYTSVLPSLHHPVRFIFRQQIQPWHPSSTLTHEAAAAVLRLSPSHFWDFSAALFAHQKSFFDSSVVRETRNDTYKRLAKLAGEVAGAETGTGVYKLLEVSDQPDKDGGLNGGNGVTDDVKVMVKMNRLVGVHVTPTVVVDGVVEGRIASSWDAGEWGRWLDGNMK